MSRQPLEILVTTGAERDLAAVHDCITQHDSPANADRVLGRLLQTIRSLATQPERGTHPHELAELGIRDYRQVFYKPYRIIYRTLDRRVLIYLIADGRRDMQRLLTRRLLG